MRTSPFYASYLLAAVLCSLALANIHAKFFNPLQGIVSLVHHAIAYVPFIGNLTGLISYKQQLKKWPLAPEIVSNYFKDRCRDQGMETSKIEIRIRPDEFHQASFEAFGNATLVLNQTTCKKIESALLSPGEENSRYLLGCGTYLDHEIGHLRQNDSTKRFLVAAGSTFALHSATHYLLPATTTTATQFALNGIRFCLLAIARYWCTEKITNTYIRYQEKRADEYAYSVAQDPAALREMAQTIVEKQEAIVDLLAGTQPINPAFSSEIKEQVDKVKEKLKEEYTNQTSTPPAPYVAWVKEQKDTCLAVEKILLPEHPPLAESLQATLAAAERLEAAAAA